MSIHVEIKLNTKVLTSYSIHKVRENINGIEGLNEYRVERTNPEVRPGPDDALVSLMHYYEDPVESLVGRAIQRAEHEWGDTRNYGRTMRESQSAGSLGPREDAHEQEEGPGPVG